MMGTVSNGESQHAMMMQTPDLTQQEGLMSKGTQFQDRNDMMSSANLAQAAQNFQLQ